MEWLLICISEMSELPVSHGIILMLLWFTLLSVTYLAWRSFLLLADSAEHLKNSLIRLFVSSSIRGWCCAGSVGSCCCAPTQGTWWREPAGLSWVVSPFLEIWPAWAFVWSVCVCPVQMQYSQNERIRTALQKQYFLCLQVRLLQGFLNLEASYDNGIERASLRSAWWWRCFCVLLCNAFYAVLNIVSLSFFSYLLGKVVFEWKW